MNPRLETLQTYPFQRLTALKVGVTGNPAYPHVAWSLGEPKHAPPKFVVSALTEPDALTRDLQAYPPTRGSDDLRSAISSWLAKRFHCQADPDRHVLPVNGTREALFAFAQAMLGDNRGTRVMMPVPFYQIYEGAALLAGAAPHYLPCPSDNGYLPDFDSVTDAEWAQCALLYICSPGNPTGSVIDLAGLERLIELAHRFDFIIAADECYSEIYANAPPPGLLEAASRCGNDHFGRCVVFHSLSKRSNLPGLRSGFVAGDANLLEKFLLYRTYHGSAMALHTQRASAAAWRDEQHVADNRAIYSAKFEAVLPILEPVLDVRMPDAAFYLWVPHTGARRAVRETAVRSTQYHRAPRHVSGPAAGEGAERQSRRKPRAHSAGRPARGVRGCRNASRGLALGAAGGDPS